MRQVTAPGAATNTPATWACSPYDAEHIHSFSTPTPAEEPPPRYRPKVRSSWINLGGIVQDWFTDDITMMVWRIVSEWVDGRLRWVGGALLAAGGAVLVWGVLAWWRPVGIWVWLSRWWPLLVGAVLLLGGTLLWRRAQPAPVATTTDTSNQTERWSRIVSLVTAVTALGALVFTALSLRATRDQIGVTEQGQLTDRYTRAIDQLGSAGPDHLQVRLGGIFALERLAKDSPRDQSTVVEVLIAFLHSTSPRPAAPGSCSTVPADVQAAFVVLTRRDTSGEDPHQVLDLTNLCLAGVQAPGANVTSLALTSSDLHGARLTHLHGSGVLVSTDFIDASLYAADLHNSYFLGTNFAGAYLSAANFARADLDHVTFANADLTDANLTSVDLIGVDLTGAKHDELTKTTDAVHDATTRGAWW